MLSTSIIKNAGQASSYFMERDDYYRKEGEGFEQPSKWYGKGAEKLKLIGNVDKEVFDNLLSGELPNGARIGVSKSGKSRHRAGFDLTLSVPKSWSIAHYATKDPIFAEITEKAAQLTADLIERDCAMASRFENEKQVMELTGNLVFAFHYHRLSREGDMQDHIHMNVMNLTQRKDGEWRALRSDDPKKFIHEYSEGFLERVRARKKHYGEVFSLHIAHLAQKNNLAVSFDEKGKWKLAGISPEMIEAFSTRRKQIEAHMAEKGVSGANAAEVSALETRKRKTTLQRNEVEASLDKRLQDFQPITMEKLSSSIFLNEKQEALTEENVTQENHAKKAIEYAISHLSETTDVLTEEKLLVCAMRHYFARLDPLVLLKAIAEKEKEKALYVIEDKGMRRLVSALHIEREKEIISCLPEFKKTKSLELIETKNKHANELINSFSSKAKASKIESIILCHSKKEAEDKERALGKKCLSVSHYLAQSQKEHKPQLLIIEQAHRLTTQQGHQIINLLKQKGHYGVLLYDKQQPQNQQPGYFVRLLSDNGIQVQKFDPIENRKNHIAVIKHDILDKDQRLEKIVEHYVAYKHHEPEKHVLIVVQNKIDVQSINQKVQSALLSEGLLGKNYLEVKHYQPVYMTTEQLTQASQYKRGQYVSFSKSYRSLKVKKDHYYEMDRRVGDSNSIYLKVGEEKIPWDPSKIAGARKGVVRVFSPETIRLYQGERVFTTSTIEGVAKNRSFIVNKITPKKITLKGETNKNLTLKTNDPLVHHLSLGYAKTISSAQSHTVDVILAEQTTGLRATTAKGYYQLCNQARDKMVLYTDDLDKHTATLEKYKGDSKPVVDHLLEKWGRKEKTLESIEEISTKTIKREQNLAQIDGENKKSLLKLTKYVLSHLSEREAVFTAHQVAAMLVNQNKRLAGRLDFPSLDKALDYFIKKGILIPCRLHGEEMAFTTKRALKCEASIFQDARLLMKAKVPTFERQELNNLLTKWQDDNKSLTPSQQAAIESMLLTPHKLTLINGLAGVGKTTLLEAVNTLLKEKNIQLIGLAPTNEAVRQLQMRGLPSYTLDAYLGMRQRLHQEGKEEPARKEMIVLDEASMASSKKFSQLLKLTQNTQTDLVFIGDVKQLPSIEQGKMFWQLQKMGIETTLVDDIVRQRPHPDYLNLVKKIYQGNFRGVLDDMDKKGWIHEDKETLSSSERLHYLADLMMKHTPEERKNTSVIVPANEDRKAYNSLYRKILKEREEIGKEEYLANVLTQVNLTSTQKSQAMNYKRDQVLLFHKSIPECEIKFGEHLTITDIKHEKNYLILENEKGEKTGINVSRFRGANSHQVSVYQAEQRHLSEGERIRWQYTDKALERINMQEAKVIAVQENKATVLLENKQTQVLDLCKQVDLHWDYAYSSTVYTEQGNTKQFVALYMISDQKYLASQPGFLVAMTRAIESGVLVTDDKEKLARRIEQTSGIKTSSLESLNYGKQKTFNMVGVEKHVNEPSNRANNKLTIQKENTI